MRLSPKRQADWMSLRLTYGVETPETYLTRGGVVEVIRLGRGDPIILVPGLAGGWRLLEPLARQLARSYEVFLYGLKGDRGPLDSTRHASVGDYARDLAGVIEHLRLERPTVFGVSFGGAIALELAAEQPGRLGALIAYGAEARFHAGLGATIARRVLERYSLPPDNPFINQFFNILHGGKPESDLLASFVVERCWETDQGVMASRLRALESFDVADRLWRIDVPTLILAGSNDVVVPAARQRALAGAIAGARYAAIPGAGHVGFLTHGPAVARRVGGMLHALQGSMQR
jgi:pimeloyl-ACP methyl ester carboxylesterase